MFLRYVYIVFVGLIVAGFIGVGIAAFYPEPKAPEPPLSIKYSQNIQINDVATLNKIRAEETSYDQSFKAYQLAEQSYNRNISIITLISAVLILAGSLTILKQIIVIADGTLLGGVLTLGYSIVRGFGVEDNRFRFLVMSASLLITLTLGYMKFIRKTVRPQLRMI